MALDLNNVQSDYLKSEGVFTLKATNKSDLDANTIAYLESSDKHAFLDNGTLVFEDSDGTTQIVDSGVDNAEVNLSKIDASVLSAAADIAYLAQNTGVLTTEMNKTYQSLGLDPNDQMASVKKAAILRAAGYKPGEQADFYGSNTAVDQGAKILSDRWQDAPTEAQISEHNAAIESGEKEGTPITATPVNSNAANIAYVRQELLKNNVDLNSTKATTSLAGVGGGNLSPYGMGGVSNIDEIRALNDSNKEKYGVNNPNFKTSDQQLDIFEWDNLFDSSKKEKEVEVGTGGSGNQAGSGYISQQVQPVPNPTITPAQVYTADADTFKIGPEAVTPYFNPPNTSVTSTTTTPAEKFDAGIDRQNTAYSARAPQQAQYYQPQTMQEMTDAGQPMDSLNQKLYRNSNTGHQLYIPHRGEEPLSPIPAGYVLVNQGGTFAGAYNPVTAGGNTQLGVNQGGMIQGFDAGGMPVNGVSDAAGHTSHLDGSTHTDVAVGEYGKVDPSKVFGNYSFQDPMDPTKTITQTSPEYMQTRSNMSAQSAVNPAATIAPMGVQYMQEQYMPGTVIESTAGQALPTAPMVAGDQIAQVSNVTQSTGAINPGAAQANFTQAAPTVKTTMEGLTPAQQQAIARDAEGNPIRDAAGNVLFTSAPTQLIDAQQQVGSSIGQPLTDAQGNVLRDAEGNIIFNVTGETGTSTAVSAPIDRTLQRTREPLRNQDGTVVRDTDGNIMYKGSELISGTGVDQSKVGTAFGTDQVTAASLTGELATLMKDFEGGNTPVWAAGAMRQATAVMNDRGLGASSMAGQAIIQAAMEAALPIAQIEAGNKQQVALFNGEQRAKFLGLEFDQAFQAKVQNAARVSEIANLNFTAKQTIALENSRAANTVNLADMSNKQAVVMAEAAALSQLDMANLNNRQQAAVQNAQNFLQVDMANLTNAQQTAIFKAQTSSQALLSDVAQANAAAQFNATSENQTNQFFSNLVTQVSQFNAAQKNAIDQFNAEETNALLEFNSALQNQREMFNSQNYLAVAQANAVWRQGINTTNTEAQNLSNAQYAKDVNGLSQKALDDFWQKERDLMSFAFAQAESANDRVVSLMLGEQTLQGMREKLEFEDAANESAFYGNLLFGDFSLGKYLYGGKT